MRRPQAEPKREYTEQDVKAGMAKVIAVLVRVHERLERERAEKLQASK